MKLSSLHSLCLTMVLLQPWAGVRGDEPAPGERPADPPSPPAPIERREGLREERGLRRGPDGDPRGDMRGPGPGPGADRGRRGDLERALGERGEELERLRRRLREATASGREREAVELDREVGRLERELESVGRPREGGRGEAGMGRDMERRRRMEHLREAVRHLREGGFPDMAVRLEQMAEGLGNGPGRERVAGRAEARRPAGPGDREGAEAMRGEVRELRRQVERLTRRVEELAEAPARAQDAN